jgi:ribonuclease III family protein
LSDQHSGQTLAYLGDALIELSVRQHLLAKGWTKVNDLHKRAIRFTSAVGQSKVAIRWLEDQTLAEEELAVYKRGRNAVGYRKPPNADREAYQRATGIEALFGHLHMTDQSVRLSELMASYLAILEEFEA